MSNTRLSWVPEILNLRHFISLDKYESVHSPKALGLDPCLFGLFAGEFNFPEVVGNLQFVSIVKVNIGFLGQMSEAAAPTFITLTGGWVCNSDS